MPLREQINAIRVEDEIGRQQVLAVMRATYRDEKKWIASDEKLISEADLANENVSWFVVRVQDRPVGVLRVLYEPPLELYQEYGFKFVDKGFDLESFLRENRIAEIGRFAVLAEYRKYIAVVAALMRAACTETVRRDFTHYITDVFEGEANSPYDFHTRVMGFQTVATHDVGELNCPNRRITMLLDLKEAYRRLRRSQSWVFRFLTGEWEEKLHQQMMGNEALTEAEAASRR